MSMKPDILQELQELAPILINIPRKPVFEVPEGYFEQLSGAVMLSIGKESTAGRQQDVPAGYFEGLAGSIMQRIKAEAESAVQENPEYSALLNSIGRQMPFMVPAGYFEGLAGSIAAKTSTAPAAKVVTMHKSRRIGWVTYAAAACVVGLLGFFAIRMFNNTGSAGIANNKENMIIAGTGMSYKQMKEMNVEAEMQKVNGTEFESYLCLTGVVACNEPKDDNLQKQLSQISDEDIDAFLEAQN